jgi:hypothetical protein
VKGVGIMDTEAKAQEVADELEEKTEKKRGQED